MGLPATLAFQAAWDHQGLVEYPGVKENKASLVSEVNRDIAGQFAQEVQGMQDIPACPVRKVSPAPLVRLDTARTAHHNTQRAQKVIVATRDPQDKLECQDIQVPVVQKVNPAFPVSTARMANPATVDRSARKENALDQDRWASEALLGCQDDLGVLVLLVIKACGDTLELKEPEAYKEKKVTLDTEVSE